MALIESAHKLIWRLWLSAPARDWTTLVAEGERTEKKSQVLATLNKQRLIRQKIRIIALLLRNKKADAKTS